MRLVEAMKLVVQFILFYIIHSDVLESLSSHALRNTQHHIICFSHHHELVSSLDPASDTVFSYGLMLHCADRVPCSLSVFEVVMCFITVKWRGLRFDFGVWLSYSSVEHESVVAVSIDDFREPSFD